MTSSRIRPFRFLVVSMFLAAPGMSPITAADVKVQSAEELRRAVAAARPGTRILVAPGEYAGGLFFSGLNGAPERPIAICGAEPKNPPVIRGGGSCLHLSDVSHLELRDLVFTGGTGNGINIDDGGSYDTPSHHLLFRNIVVRDVGRKGNEDGIKLSGVDDFRLEGCTVERWGRGGSAVDMVGCHRGLIEGCSFRDLEEKAAANGVQTKGGSSEIIVRRSRFEHAGDRAVNIGGSTGLSYFRPKPQGYEAKDITVEGCTFIGSQAPVAFVGVDGAAVRFNTFYRPRRWILRILQETRGPDFVPSRNGAFTDNIVAYRSGEISTPVNVGPGTAPETFTFARNFWCSLDDPAKSNPRLPSPEEDPAGGADPRFRNPAKGDLRTSEESPARGHGAGALPEPKEDPLPRASLHRGDSLNERREGDTTRSCLAGFPSALIAGSLERGPGGQVEAEAPTGPARSGAEVSGELKLWHRVTLTFEGPRTSETALPDPFVDFRLDVVFTHGTSRYVVPGFYAADGNASETGAAEGSRWRAHFTPDAEGVWEYAAVLRAGEGIAVADDPRGRELKTFAGSFTVGPTDKKGRDHRAKGALRYAGSRYLKFAGSGDLFLKGGADSPENFLAFADFDGTYDSEGLQREGEAKGSKFLHAYAPHVRDWRPGDPTWKGGKGKGIIGALNYLASKGMNSVYFLTMNVGGDGKDVWPWTSHEERLRFDVSKLDQWEIVFSHMDELGLLLHVITQETENDQLLDGGALGPARRLYYRELIARFAHHPALVWNLGEENTNSDAERRAFAKYIHELDPYRHPVVVHTYPGKYDEVYKPLLGYPFFHGPSLQTNDTHAQTVKWVRLSTEAGRPWVVCLDEIGPAEVGVKPDAADFQHDEVRKKHLWGNLMGGGAGVEWYFGYKFPHNDLNCEDWRSRDRLWDLTRRALEFFERHVPLEESTPRDDLLSGAEGYCLACLERGIHAVYLFGGGAPKLEISPPETTEEKPVSYDVKWYDPRKGGDLQDGSVKQIQVAAEESIRASLGRPPADPDEDWAVLVRRRR